MIITTLLRLKDQSLARVGIKLQNRTQAGRSLLRMRHRVVASATQSNDQSARRSIRLYAEPGGYSGWLARGVTGVIYGRRSVFFGGKTKTGSRPLPLHC